MNPTDADGNATQLLMPGTWSLFMNESAAQRYWTLDTSDAPVLMNENTSLDVVYAHWKLRSEVRPIGILTRTT